MALVRICAERDVPSGRALRVETADLDIVLVRCDGALHAVGNVCAHQHFSVLHQGVIEGHTVTCPMHGWRFDLRNGRSLGADGKIASYRVVVEAGEVFVEVPGSP